jgi:hypothetical protein
MLRCLLCAQLHADKASQLQLLQRNISHLEQHREVCAQSSAL